MKKIAVIGLGLMGGSMVKALKASGKYHVTGYDILSSVCLSALENGCIDSIWDGQSKINADITVLAVSPAAAERFLNTGAGVLRAGSILTDICGVKREIVRLGEQVCDGLGVRFVGGHPMAGRELNGFENSTASLFAGRSYILTETENTETAAVETLSQMALDMGCAAVTLTTPEEHDRMIAYTSQLPHVLAGAYVKSPTCEKHKGFSAGSYHDVSRVASVDENLWSELFLANKENLLYEIDTLLENIEAYRRAIADNNRDEIRRIIRDGRTAKERDIIKNGSEKPHKFG